MTTLAEAGVRVACLTNGSAYLTSSFINRTGLGALVDRVIAVGEVYQVETCGGGALRRRCWTSRRNGWRWSPRTTSEYPRR